MKAKLCSTNPKDWYVHWRDETGRQHRKRGNMNRIKSIREKRIYADRLCEIANRQLSSGVCFEPEPAVKVLREIVEGKKHSLRRRSWQSYVYAVNALENWLPDKRVTIEQITKSDARAFLDHLARTQKGKSVNGMKGFLSAIFNHYAQRNEGYVNPFKGVQKYRQEVGKNIAFTDSQKTELWQAMTPELRLFTRFIYFTYIRPLELLRLRVSDIRTDMGVIIIHGHQSKNRLQQSVEIPDSFIGEIRAMQYDKLPGQWYLFGRGLKPAEKPLGRNQVSKLHSEVLKGMKFNNPDLTLYSWKHTGVVAAYKEKIDPYAIMRQLRHHSLDMTQVYLKSLGLVRNEEFGRRMV